MGNVKGTHKPVVLAFAGPNGSGKTTVMRSLPVFGTYDNSDKPSLIFRKEHAYVEAFTNSHWSEPKLRKLLGLDESCQETDKERI